MRFMMMVKGDPQAENPDETPMPPEDVIGAMTRYNEDLVKAGVLLAAEGLFDSARGARVIYKAGRRTVVDGPFAEAKELVAGFWIIQVSSLEEAVEWAKRCPVETAVQGTDREAVIEIRQIAEIDEITTATDEQREAVDRLREQMG